MISNRCGLATAGLLFSLSPLAAFAQTSDSAEPPVYDKTIPVKGPAEQMPTRADNSDFGLVLGVGLELGGDRVVTVYFDDNSKQSIDAGDGLSGEIGVHYHTAGNFDFRTTFGYKIWDTTADNAHPYVGRYVWKGVADYFFSSNWFVGGGVVHHSGVKFHGSSLGPNFDFKDATGTTIEAGWAFIALTYTLIDYKDEFGYKYDANNIGIAFTGRF